MARFASWLRADPFVFRFAAVYACVQFALAFWDLPGSHGWENDSVAPRDLFGGLANNLTPGQAHRYALLHYVLVAVASLPAWLAGLLAAQGWSHQSLQYALLSPPVMTGISTAAKALSVAMSSVALVALASVARRLFGTPASRWTVLFAAANVSFSYYGRTANLDGPYLMWTVLALERLVAVNHANATRTYRLVGLCAALGVATKDQAYAPLAPLLLAALVLNQGGTTWRQRCKWLAFGFVPTYVLASGALLNPTGFVARVRLLLGPNNNMWQAYQAGVEGTWVNLMDLIVSMPSFWWPSVFVATAGVSALVVVAQERTAPRLRRALCMLPLLVGFGNLVLFALVVKRCEHRFVLPLGFMMSCYLGWGFSWAFDVARRSLPKAVRLVDFVALALVALLLRPAASLALTQWYDSRTVLISWLTEHAADKTVETYGGLVYQPHFEDIRRIVRTIERVDSAPVGERNSLWAAQERQGHPANAHERQPDFVLISDAYAERFALPTFSWGHRDPVWRQEARRFMPDTHFFNEAVQSRMPHYQLRLLAQPRFPAWLNRLGFTPIQVHSSTGYAWRVFERSSTVGLNAGTTSSTVATATSSPTTAAQPKLRSAPEDAISREP